MLWKVKNWSRSASNPDQHENLITLARAYHVWSTSVNAFVSYPAHRTIERMTDATITLYSTGLGEIIILTVKNLQIIRQFMPTANTLIKKLMFTDQRCEWSSAIVVNPRDVSQVHLNVLGHVRHVVIQPFHCRQELFQKSKKPENIWNVLKHEI